MITIRSLLGCSHCTDVFQPSHHTSHHTSQASHPLHLPAFTPHTSPLLPAHPPLILHFLPLTPHSSHLSHYTLPIPYTTHLPPLTPPPPPTPPHRIIPPPPPWPPPPTHPQHHILPIIPTVQYVRVDTVAATQVETFWTSLQNMPRRTGRGHRHNGLIRNLAKLEDEEGGRREERHRKSSHET